MPTSWESFVPFELAVIIPTLNEAGNIKPLLERLEQALQGIDWEVIFVDDDSIDGTADTIRQIAHERLHIRCLRRIGRRGLSSACIEGMLATSAPYLAVMDADLQHDEQLLPRMLEAVKARHLDIIVASCFMSGGSVGEFSSARERLSRIGILVSRLITKLDLTDPLSGFFMLRRAVLDDVAHSLSGQGFKILLDMLASASRPLKCDEIPLHFQPRFSGESKLDALVTLEFVILIADKLFGKIIPVRFILFVVVGALGICIHLALLGLLYKIAEMSFYGSQALATLTAMTVNFYCNNKFTYRDRQLKGHAYFRGLLSFYIACAIGAIMNFQLAEFIFNLGAPWPLAGFLGALVGSVWNYGITSTFTWTSSTLLRR